MPFSEELETLLRDLGPCWHNSLTELMHICLLHLWYESCCTTAQRFLRSGEFGGHLSAVSSSSCFKTRFTIWMSQQKLIKPGGVWWAVWIVTSVPCFQQKGVERSSVNPRDGCVRKSLQYSVELIWDQQPYNVQSNWNPISFHSDV